MNTESQEQISLESRESLYHQLANIIRHQIETGEYVSGQKIPTFQELIETYKVSITTVKLAINELVNEGLLYSRQGKGTFVSSKKPGTSKTGLLGLLVTDIRNPFYSNLAHAIQNHARDFNYGVLHVYTNDTEQNELEAINLLFEKKVDGVIATPLANHSVGDGYQKLIENKIPFVFIDRYLPEIPADYIMVNNEDGVSQAIHYLLSMGHSKIACISAEPVNRFTLQRVEAYKKVLKENEIKENWIISSILQDDDGGFEAAKRLLSMENRPTAVFTTNDIIAIGVLRACHEIGIKIPEELSIIGFDNIPLSEHTHPPLTTITQPINKMGSLATELLMKRITHNMEGDYQKIILEPKLIIRGSCKSI